MDATGKLNTRLLMAIGLSYGSAEMVLREIEERDKRIDQLETALLKVMERGHEWSDCPQNSDHAKQCSCCIAIAAVAVVGKGGAGC